jgi:hypothetical protein
VGSWESDILIIVEKLVWWWFQFVSMTFNIEWKSC